MPEAVKRAEVPASPRAILCTLDVMNSKITNLLDTIDGLYKVTSHLRSEEQNCIQSPNPATAGKPDCQDGSSEVTKNIQAMCARIDSAKCLVEIIFNTLE